MLGATLGLLAAAALGVLIYRGAVRINLRKFFQWTGVFLIVVAAGVLAYGVHDLQEAGILPGEDNLAWDVSAQMSPTSIVGTVLKAVFNFSPQTTVLQAVVYFAYLIPVMFLFVRTAFGVWDAHPRPPFPPPSPTPNSQRTSMNLRSAMPAGGLAVVAALALAACVPNNAEESQSIAVISTADKCTVATTEVPAGPIVFRVTNNGDDVTEFYLLAEDGAACRLRAREHRPWHLARSRGALGRGRVRDCMQAWNGRRRHQGALHRDRRRHRSGVQRRSRRPVEVSSGPIRALRA